MATWNKNDKKKELDTVKQCVDTIMKLKIKCLNDGIPIDNLEIMIKEIFPFFVDNYYSLFKLTLKTDDVSMLYVMIDRIMDVCQGDITLDAVKKDISDILAEKFLYPTLGKPPTSN